MSKIYQFAAAVALAGLVSVSCSREKVTPAGGYGYLDLSLRTDAASELVVKSAEAPAADQTFSLTLTCQETGAVTKVADHRSLIQEPLRLPVGHYRVEAASGEIRNAAWSAPVYAGSAEVLVKPEQTQSCSVVCALANTMVSVSFPANTADYFSEYKVTVDNGRGDAMVFGTAAGTLADTAYFAVTGTLNWELYMRNNDGVLYRTEPATITGVKARQHYKLTFSLGANEDPVGGAAFMVSVDGTTSRKDYPLVVDFSQSSLPAISASFELTNEISFPMGDSQSKTLSFTAQSGISSLVLSHRDEALSAKGLPEATELVDASASEISALTAAGVSAAAVGFGAQSASVDLTDFLSRLSIGTYTFYVNLTDAKYHSDARTLNIRVISPVDAEAISAVPWAKFAILKAKWFADERPDGLYFQYRKTSDAGWTDCTGGIVFDDAAKTFSVELCGLTASTDYIFRAVSAKDKETREVAFSTEGAEDLHNLSFDNWYQDGSCWYPNASSSYKVWDSANPGTSGLGVVPTTPESSDVAVSGSGKKAARLESMTAFGQFAAGNIYVGQFGKVAGLGAILNWGYRFTSRPLALKGYTKYMPKTIDYAKAPYTDLKGTTDVGQVKILLVDWNGMFEINTSKSQFFDDSDASVIGRGELLLNATQSEYVPFTIPVEYRSKTRVPSFIVVVGAASRYGDYFTGGKGSVLLLDEFSFVYDPSELTEAERVKVGYR